MILTGNEIYKNVKKGGVKIDPFNTSQITTNSYDLRLGGDLIQYTSKTLDPKKPAKYKVIHIPKSGYIMKPGQFLLGSSLEKIGGTRFVPIIHAKSGIARLGLFVHVTADLIDIGSYGNCTFQLFSTLPIKLHRGMLIGQVSFWVPKGKILKYHGKYQGSEGPKPSLIHLDYKKNGKSRKIR